MRSISCISSGVPTTQISGYFRMRTGLFCHPGKPVRLTNGPLPYSDPYPNRDGKQIFVLGTKERGELVHFDMKSHQFLPFLSGIFRNGPNILPGWKMGRLCLLPRSRPVAQP
jgi:hypothetical protein